VRQKDTYLRAQFYHVKARRGPKKAIIAVAASILTAVYHMLKDGKMYQDLGPNHFQPSCPPAAAVDYFTRSELYRSAQQTGFSARSLDFWEILPFFKRRNYFPGIWRAID
jgi:hypothetical protein